ncbi:MAG: hypothetical protein OFPII_28740 [Osedax symbiont Rs1]|nr:MAG: hypothetical protein OFPII_28740 [Osedax symbiont Rs1]
MELKNLNGPLNFSGYFSNRRKINNLRYVIQAKANNATY